MIEGFKDFPAFFADCKARGREIIGRGLIDGKWQIMPFGLVDPEQQLKTAFSWWKTGTKPPLLDQSCNGVK